MTGDKASEKQTVPVSCQGTGKPELDLRFQSWGSTVKDNRSLTDQNVSSKVNCGFEFCKNIVGDITD